MLLIFLYSNFITYIYVNDLTKVFLIPMYIVLLYVKYILLFIMTCIFIETRNFMFSFDKFLCGFINYDWLKTWFCLKKLLVISTFSFIHDNTSMKLKSYFFFSLEYVHKWYICDWISSVWFHIFFTFWMNGKIEVPVWIY